MITNEIPSRSSDPGYSRAQAMLVEAALAGWSVTLLPLDQIEVHWHNVRAELPWEIEIIIRRGACALADFLQERHAHYDTIIVYNPDNMAILRSVLQERPNLLDGVRLIYDVGDRIEADISLAKGADLVVRSGESAAELRRTHQCAPVYVLDHSVGLFPNGLRSMLNDRVS